MLSIHNVKTSTKVYLQTKELMLHPIFFMLQLFASLWIVTKVTILRHHRVNTFFYEFLIDFGATLILLILTLTSIGKDKLFDIPKKHWKDLAWCGVVGVTLAQTFFTMGRVNSRAAETSVGMLLVPMCVIIHGFIVGPERPKLCKCIGTMLALLGASLLLIKVREYKIAECCLIIHALCASSTVITQRRLVRGPDALDPLVVSTISFMIGTPLMFIAFLISKVVYFDQTFAECFYGFQEIVGTLYLLQLAYAITFLVLCWCVSRGSIQKNALYVSSRAIFSMLIDLFYDLTLKINQYYLFASVTLMIFGFAIAFISKKREQLKKLRIEKNVKEDKTREVIDSFKRKLLS